MCFPAAHVFRRRMCSGGACVPAGTCVPGKLVLCLPPQAEHELPRTVSVPALLVHRLTEAHPCGDQSRATIGSMGGAFDLAAALRRIRRSADMSQRELAAITGLAVSTLGHAEGRARGLPVGGPGPAAAVAGPPLGLVRGTRQEGGGMSGG